MKKEEKLKQLKMALGEQKTLLIDLGDNYKYKLTWDAKIKNYRGYSLFSKIDFGIWTVEFLLDNYEIVEVL